MDAFEKYKTLKDLPVVTWVKTPKAGVSLKGVIQFVHGMCERKERYEPIIEYFTNRGFICVIPDLRGHGENVEYIKDLGYFGEEACSLLVEDVHAVNVFIQNNYVDLPRVLVAHSMGSIIARAYLKKHDKDVDFVFLSGAPANNFSKYTGTILTEIEALFFDATESTPFVDKIFYSTLEKRFGTEGKNSWLCTDKDQVKKYNDDEKCNFTFKINGYNTLFKLLISIYSKRGWAVNNSQLPIYYIVGSDDVCVGGKKALNKEAQIMRKVGYNKVHCKMFEGMRHEIFNEPDHEKVFAYMLEKLNKYNIY